MAKKTYREPAHWTAQNRDKMPDGFFLLITGSGESKVRKFPAGMYRDGKWVWSKKGLLAARSRAAQYHYPQVFNKTTRLLNRYFLEEGHEPYKTWAEQQREKG